MILLGLLLVLGLAGLILVTFMDNDGLFTAPAGAVELLGYQAEPTVGQVFLIGTAAGALMLVGLMMLFGGTGRRARRGIAARRELRAQRAEMLELQRRHDSVTSELAAQRAADAEAVDTRTARDADDVTHERLSAR
jgi:hypothetical protein